MAAEHVQLLASLAVGQMMPEQLDDTVKMGNVATKQTSSDEPKEKEPDSNKVDSNAQQNVPTVIYGNLRKKRKVGTEDSTRNSDFKVVPTKERSSSNKVEMRRPVRPIDRQKMRPWLKNLLDKGSVFGLNWMKREEGIFQISWRHASRLGWNLETDGDVFERWARHTGIYKDGDTPEPKRWKANFRCALHSLPDVKELTSPDDRKGRNASRTYRFLTPNEVQPPVKRKHRYSIQLPYLYEHPNSEDSGSQNADSDERASDEDTGDGQSRQAPHCDHDYAARVDKPQAEAGGMTTSAIFQRHGSGYVLIKSKDAHEYEFRLTSSADGTAEAKQQLANQKSSPQKKSPARRRNSSTSKSGLGASSAGKKGKSKDSSKGGFKQKGGRKLGNKRKKIAGEKGGAPVSRPPSVTLQALLAGRQVNRNAKRSKSSRSSGGASRKAKSGKVGGAAGKGSTVKGSGESGTGTPTQRQGLDACMLLLEAATQLDRMDSLSSADTSTTTAKIVSTARTPSKTSSSSQAKVPSSASTLVTASPPEPVTVSSTPAASGTMFTVPQGSPSMLHQYLGLSAVTSASKTPALSSLLSVANQATTSAVAVSAGAQLTPPFKVVGFVSNIEPMGVPVIAQNIETPEKDGGAAVSVALAGAVSTQQPVTSFLAQSAGSVGAGTSMLKHLLRLTCPPPARPTLVTTAPTATLKPITTPVTFLPFAAPVISASTKNDETNNTVTAVVKEECVTPEEQVGMKNFEIVAECELGSSQEETWAEKGEKSFPYLRVSTSKVYVKPEPQPLDADGDMGGNQTELGPGGSVGEGHSQPEDSVMQFIFSANGSNLAVVKTETPDHGVADDVIAINSAYNTVKSAAQGPQLQSSSSDTVHRISFFVQPSTGELGPDHQLVTVKAENCEEVSTSLSSFQCTYSDQSLTRPTSCSENLSLPTEEQTADGMSQGLV